MKSELEAALAAKYPFFVPTKLIDGGCAHGDGWYKLLDRFLEEYAKLSLPEGFHITQVKEKLGELRVYAGFSRRKLRPEVERLAKMVRYLSIYTCEVCGEPGELRSIRKWKRTLCRKHYRQVKRK